MKTFSLLAALAAALSPPASAGETPLDTDVAMDAHPGYMSEHCLQLEAGDTLSYRMRSPHPVDFNVHYHDEADTLYPIRANGITSHKGRVEAKGAGTYCFMWTNAKKQDSSYKIRLELNRRINS